MSLITCTSDCFFQHEGECTLSCAITGNILLPGSQHEDCPNFRPKILSLQSSQSLSDILNPNQG